MNKTLWGNNLTEALITNVEVWKKEHVKHIEHTGSLSYHIRSYGFRTLLFAMNSSMWICV